MEHLYLNAGDKLFNGVTISEDLARAYNSVQDRIASFRNNGQEVPIELLNGAHNLINSTRVLI